MAPLVKICGLMRQSDVTLCCRMGVDICGFVTEYPLPVPWNLTKRQCGRLLPFVSPPAKSCIVTGGERAHILSLALSLRPELVQLHFHETIGDTLSIAEALLPHGIGVIKTIPLDPEERIRQFGTSNAARCAEFLCQGGVWAILIDGRGPSNASSSGGAADLSLYQEVKAAVSCRVMLGGGITPENGREIIQSVRPDIIDSMTGVEVSPGVKSAEKLTGLLSCRSDKGSEPALRP